jgi:hypothetical protein
MVYSYGENLAILTRNEWLSSRSSKRNKIKTIHAVGFHLCRVQKRTKLIYDVKNQASRYHWRGRRSAWRGGFARKALCVDLRGVHIGDSFTW